MGKELDCKLKCGCEIWTGNDFMGRNYLLIEHCPIHELVRIEELEDEQRKKGRDKMRMSKWKEHYHKGDLTGAEIEFGGFRLSVHHWLGCGDVWFVSCYGVIDRKELKNQDFIKAKAEGMAMLKNILYDAVVDFEDEVKKSD